MYGIPEDLDISVAIGGFITQFCVGAFDIQFDFGGIHFAVQSEIRLKKDEKEIALWQADSWPDSAFYQLFNVDVSNAKIISRQEIEIQFANGISMHIYDNSDQYESMQIKIKGEDHSWIII